MDYRGKKTVLDDNASIYTNRENKTEKQKWNEMDKKQRWEYFKNYYLFKIVAAVAVLAVAVSIAATVIANSNNVTLLSVAIYDGMLPVQAQEEIVDDLTTLLVKDEKNESILFDRSYQSDDYSTESVFSVRYFAGEIDVVIMPESRFANKAQAGFCQSLSKYLSEEDYDRLSEYIVSYKNYDESGQELVEGSEVDCGIYIDFLDIYSGYSFIERPVLGVISSQKNEENVRIFLNYLFENEN